MFEGAASAVPFIIFIGSENTNALVLLKRSSGNLKSFTTDFTTFEGKIMIHICQIISIYDKIMG